METYLLDWANLLLRWAHVIVAIAWIGSSFYFVFFDSSLTPPQDEQLKRDGVSIPMTTGEFGLLKVMAQHPRAPLSRDKLTELARGREHDTFDRAIDVQISRLRKLLGEDPSNPRYIQTVWGRGYVFIPD